MPTRPNVIFVLTDDQGYPPVGRHGHPFLKTPHLDRFHDEAARFEQFHTGTTCAPTRAGLLTGHHCNATGVWHTIGGRSLLRADEWSLATALAENGYATGVFGKWQLGDTYPYRPGDRGFQTRVCHGGGGIGQQPDWWGNDYFDDTYLVNGVPERFEGYCTDVFFDEAMRFIEAHRDTPFFCYLSTNAPHSPFNVPPRYRDLYLGEHTESEIYARFLGMVSNIDENFGRLRAKLGELGIEENTILVFMSDNGQTGTDGGAAVYNAGLRGMKGSPYEGGHRAPFFLRWPGGGLGEGRAIDALTAYIDFMPTVLELTGVAVPEGRTFHGRSLVPLLRGAAGRKDPAWRDRVIVTDTQRIAHPLKWRLSCVMQDTWRLVNRDELYDLAADPGQRRDVAADHPQRVARMREAYERWWALCTQQMDRDIPAVIGEPGEAEVVLRSHELRSDQTVVWNQQQVRAGEVCHGYWEIEAAQAGTYAFSLRRWPEEAGHPVAGGIEGEDVAIDAAGIAPGAEGWYRGGAALAFDTATLSIDDRPRHEKPVAGGDAAVTFHVPLERGRHHLRARFSSAAGAHMSAYYVQVRPVAKPGEAGGPNSADGG